MGVQSIDINDVLSRLHHTKKTGKGWTARCPSHEDKNSSLSVTKSNDGTILFHCHAGCSFDNIVAALGLDASECFPPANPSTQKKKYSKLSLSDLAQAKRLPADFLRQYIKEENGGLNIVYKLINGEPAPRQRRRTALKAKEGTHWLPGKGELVPFALWLLPQAREQKVLHTVEGETDALTLWFHKLPALGFPGADMGHLLKAEYLTPIETLYIHQEPDKGGATFIRGMAQALTREGFTGNAFVIRMPGDGIKDSSDLHIYCQDHQLDFKVELNKLIGQAVPLSQAILELSEDTEEDEEDNSSDEVILSAWPQPLKEVAFHGIVGEFIRLVEPHTESDLAAMVLQFLTAIGNLVGRKTYFNAENTRHYPVINCVIVANTGGSKGSSLNQVRRAVEPIDPEWAKRSGSGLSSGEGLLHEIRDPVVKLIKDKKTGEQSHEVIDEGVEDKRLLITQTEFSTVFKVAARDGNTLTDIIRQCFDCEHILRVRTRTSPLIATGGHVSIIGHITQAELLKLLSENDTVNGFANRFLWVCARRRQYLPDGGCLQDKDIAEVQTKIKKALANVKTAEIERDPEARKLWHEKYQEIAAERPGLMGAITSRARPLIMRIALIYAILDSSVTIKRIHLEAALEVWRYCVDSAVNIFGEKLGDAIAEKILSALRQEKELTRSDIKKLFYGNRKKEEIDNARDLLVRSGLVELEKRNNPGAKRPTEIWKLATANSTTLLTTLIDSSSIPDNDNNKVVNKVVIKSLDDDSISSSNINKLDNNIVKVVKVVKTKNVNTSITPDNNDLNKQNKDYYNDLNDFNDLNQISSITAAPENQLTRRALAVAEFLATHPTLIPRVVVGPGQIVTDPVGYSRWLHREISSGHSNADLLRELVAFEQAISDATNQSKEINL